MRALEHARLCMYSYRALSSRRHAQGCMVSLGPVEAVAQLLPAWAAAASDHPVPLDQGVRPCRHRQAGEAEGGGGRQWSPHACQALPGG